MLLRSIILIVSLSAAAFTAIPASASLLSPFMTSNTVRQSTTPVAGIEGIRGKIFSQYRMWSGVRYRLGGSSMRGIDCSSLMQQIYGEAFGKTLPRTTSGQINQGLRIGESQLLPGDLVFFQTRRNLRHVGVYIGGAQFVHASTSQGVTISSLRDRYWSQRFETARRILS